MKPADERDAWIRLFNRLEAAIQHHKHATAGFATDADESLYAATDRIVNDAAKAGRGRIDVPFLLHPCAEPRCEILAFGRHCKDHTTPADREHLHALSIASLQAGEAEEHWRAARLRVLEAERTAGVRRAPPNTGQ